MDEKGMTLIEVVVAILILSIAGIMFLAGFSTVIHMFGKANDYKNSSDILMTYAENKEKTNQIELKDEEDLIYTITRKGDTSPINVTANFQEIQEKSNPDVMLRIIKIDEREATSKPLSQTGTVADEMNCMTSQNNKGDYRNDTIYSKGDFVQINGEWFKSLQENLSNSKPGTPNQPWKLISIFYDATSYYEYKDIVQYKEKYWQCINIMGGMLSEPSSDKPSEWRGGTTTVDELLNTSYPGSQDMTPDYTKNCKLATN